MTNSVRRCCPACSRRWNQVCAHDCPVCNGDGVLTLGVPALLKYPAEAVSRGVEQALEMRATIDMGSRAPDIAAARTNQTLLVARMVRMGILASRTQPPPEEVPDLPAISPEDTMTVARLIAKTAAELPEDPSAAVRLAAPPLHYAVGSVPVDGARPGFSQGGYINNMSQAADPIEALVLVTREHQTNMHTGDRLAQAMVTRHSNARS